MFVASYSTKYLDFEASSSSLSRCSSSSSLFFLLRKPNPQGFRLWFSLSLPKFNPKSPKSLPNPNPQTPNLFCLPLSPRMDMLIFIDHRNIMVSSSDVNPVGLGRRSRQLFDQVWRKFSGLGQISRTSLPDERDALDALLIREGPMCEFVIPGAQNTTVLVVGATSKIGRIVVRKLMLRGYTVKALVRKADQEVVYTHYSLVNGVGEAVKQVSQTKLLQVVLVSPQTGEVYTWGWKECVPSETVFPDSVQVDQDIFESLRSNINW